MMQTEKIASLLQIRPGEGRTVTLLTALMLSPAVGGAIGSPGIEALFFARFGVEFLPYIYMALGVVTFITSVVITAVLGRVPKRVFYRILPLVLTFSLILARFLVSLDLNWFYPVLYLVMYLLWTLQALLAWGLAAMVFDTRQAKRLFPLLSAGYIFGNAIGGVITQPLVGWMGTENLLLVWAIMMLITFVLVLQITGDLGKVQVRSPRKRSNLLEDLKQGYQFVSRSRLMRWISAAGLLFGVLYFSLAFPFAKVVADQFPDEDAMAGFLGIFQGLTTGVALVIALFLANRLYAQIGFMSAILILPVIYFVGFGTMAVNAAFIAIVGFRFVQMAWLEGVARTAYQALFNIVPPERRDQTRLFLNGVPDQLGIILIGLLLAIGQQSLAPQHLYLIGLVTAGFTMVSVWWARQAYGSALVDALREGQPQFFFSEEEPFGGFQQDADAVKTVVAAISDPDPVVRRVAAEILGNLGVPEATQALVDALDDPDPDVRTALLKSLSRANASTALLEVLICLDDSEPVVRRQAIDALGELASYPRGLSVHITPFLGDTSPMVRSSAAVTLLRRGSHPGAMDVLTGMARSNNPEMRVKALEAFAEIKDKSTYDLVAECLSDPQPIVRRTAAHTLAYIDPDRCIEPLIRSLGDEDHLVREAIASTIGIIGEPALLRVLEALSEPELETGALMALEVMPFHQATENIREYARTKVTLALKYESYRLAVGNEDNQNELLNFLSESLRTASQAHGRYGLTAVGLITDQSAMAVALENLDSPDPNQKANALETLDSIGEREMVGRLMPLWETKAPGTVPEILHANNPSIDEVLLQLMEDHDRWLRACAAFVSGGVENPLHKYTLNRLAESDPDEFVRETVHAALAGGSEMDTLATLNTMDRILFLRRVPIFSNFPPAELKQIAAIAGEHFYTDGEVIVHQGEPGDEMYIIVTGEVSVNVQTAEGKTAELARRQPGEYVGEMAVISHEPRSASLVAVGDVRLLCIGQKEFEGILRERPETSLAVIRVLIDRLKEDQISEVT